MNKHESILENVTRIKDYSNPVDYFSEAVFKDGKKSIEPVEKAITAVKNELESQIEKHKKGEYKDDKFDPKAFWRHKVFKDLEDVLMDTFGFRSAVIEPFNERYNKTTDDFESKQLNAFIYNIDRYPIEGLLTDKGFYDKSKSTTIHMVFSLGLIRALEADEITAILLHEFGHGIDPALVTISYTDTNILSKYLTDRKGKLNKKEEERKKSFGAELLGVILYLLVTLSPLLIKLASWVRRMILGKEKIRQEKLDKIKEAIKKDKDKFTRIDMAEAYADNFARMYGYGPQLARSFKKMEKDFEKKFNNRIKKEHLREEFITKLTIYALQDVHKTDIHRMKNLIKEYEADMNDKSIPAAVKKQIEADKKELELVLESYTKDFDEFQNMVNKLIIDELDKKDAKEKKNDEKEIKESWDLDMI